MRLRWGERLVAASTPAPPPPKAPPPLRPACKHRGLIKVAARQGAARVELGARAAAGRGRSLGHRVRYLGLHLGCRGGRGGQGF